MCGKPPGRDPLLTPSEEWGPSGRHCREPALPGARMSLETGSCPEPAERSPAQPPPRFWPRGPRAETSVQPTRDLDPTNCELIDGCCFMHLGLWEPATWP